jgi:hypothetical protein
MATKRRKAAKRKPARKAARKRVAPCAPCRAFTQRPHRDAAGRFKRKKR